MVLAGFVAGVLRVGRPLIRVPARVTRLCARQDPSGLFWFHDRDDLPNSPPWPWIGRTFEPRDGPYSEDTGLFGCADGGKGKE